MFTGQPPRGQYNPLVKRRPPENDDADDFARAMADVKRLAPDARGRVRTKPPADVPPRATPAAPSATQRREASNAGLGLPGDSENGFVAPGVDRRELRKLKRGDYVPGDRLDLHGLTATAAVTNVKGFIDSRRTRHRCIAIVHGRGLHSEGNVAILKTRVRECLRQHRAVLAYADAPRTDGGGGAVYVLLRK